MVGVTMSYLTQCEKPKSILSNIQKTFNRLRKKVETLQNALEQCQSQCDQILRFYYEHVFPEEKALVDALVKLVKLLYKQCKESSYFSKKERNALKKLVSKKIMEIFDLAPHNEADPEIYKIFEELKGVSYQETIAGDLKDLKQEIERMCQEGGISIDLSKIDVMDNEHDIMHKLSEAMSDARSAFEEKIKPSSVKAKNKKELQKEMKAKALQELQKKGLSTIYKRLAKVFHPDLEQSSEQKKDKEAMMKKLTCAYENNDLHALLSLEMEWMKQSNGEQQIHADEQLKIYNSILKDQIEVLENSIEVVTLHPKYLPLHKYETLPSLDMIFTLRLVHSDIRERLHSVKMIVAELQGDNQKKIMLSILHNCAM